jgi:uncharacterized membrane protein
MDAPMNAEISPATSSHVQHVRLPLRQCSDLLLLLALATLLPLLPLLPTALLRVPLGLAMSLFAPGYALSAALFTREDIDTPVRAAFSFGLSVATLPVLALLLNALPWGFRPEPMMYLLALWIGVWSCVALVRRVIQAKPAPIPARIPPATWWRTLGRRAKLQVALSAGCIAVALAAGVATIALPDPSSFTTELYALGSGGLAEDYPREVDPGKAMSVQIGVTNHEGANARYRVEVRSGEQLLTQSGPFTLERGATWRETLSYALAHPGDNQQIDILLFYDDAPTPYRQLRLWVNVRGTP